MKKIITIGQVGIGAWGINLLRSFLSNPNCHLKICCDSNEEVLKKVSELTKEKSIVTSDYSDLLNDSELDAVIVTTPAVLHFEFAIKALESGKHVFVEKPLCLNAGDAEKLIDLARRNKRILMVGHLLLHHPAVKKLKEIIEKEELGNVHYIYSTRVNLGKVRTEESALWSLTAHDISVALFLLNEDPVEVTAKGAFYLKEKVEDIVFVTITFKNKIIVHIHASWLDPHKIRKFTVVGNKKMAVFDDMEKNEKIKIYDKGVDKRWDFKTYKEFLTLRNGDITSPTINMDEPLKLECEHFLECIQNNITPLTDGVSGLKVLRILEAAQKSLEAGGIPVKIKDLKIHEKV